MDPDPGDGGRESVSAGAGSYSVTGAPRLHWRNAVVTVSAGYTENQMESNRRNGFQLSTASPDVYVRTLTVIEVRQCVERG
jgi:hypothetical protein